MPFQMLRHAAALAAFTLPMAAGAQQPPTLQPLLTIGCEDCGDARQLGSILDVDINSRGEVLIVDKDAPTLRVFDATGNLKWAGGRSGQGPGEYRLPIRGKLLADGSIIVVDMTLRRITLLAPDHTVKETVNTGRFVGQASITPDGEVLVGSDDFKGHVDVLRWRSSGALTPVGALNVKPGADGSMTFASFTHHAGGLAAITSQEYVINRLKPDLTSIADIRRDVARVKRTAAEEAELQQRIGSRGKEMSAAERKKQKSAVSVLPAGSPTTLKPHFTIDALRADDRNRLWVRTMRGGQRTTLFDLFAADGSLTGTLTLPHEVSAWAASYGKFVAATENDDGVPQVVVFAVR
jgi:hypothetical protein